jgi:hypothetical protein
VNELNRLIYILGFGMLFVIYQAWWGYGIEKVTCWLLTGSTNTSWKVKR